MRRRGRALRMGFARAQAVRGTRALWAHQPEFCGRISPRFPSPGLGTDDESRRAALALTFPLLSHLRASRRDCVRLRQIPQYDDFARLERDLRALAADAPGESSRRGRRDKDDAATRERASARAPSLRVALVGRAAADEDDLVTCAHAVVEKSGERERGVRVPARPDARLEAVKAGQSPSPGKKKPETGERVRAIFVEATSEHHLARQTARHGEWLRDAQVVAAAPVLASVVRGCDEDGLLGEEPQSIVTSSTELGFDWQRSGSGVRVACRGAQLVWNIGSDRWEVIFSGVRAPTEGASASFDELLLAICTNCDPNSDPNPTPQVADPSLLALIESLLVQAPERRLGVRGSASDIRAITSHAYF